MEKLIFLWNLLLASYFETFEGFTISPNIKTYSTLKQATAAPQTNQEKQYFDRVKLEYGSVVEYWHSGGIQFGIYQSSNETKDSHRVKTWHNTEQNIDSGQIISLWEKDHMKGQMPYLSGNLSNLKYEAQRLIGKLPSRNMDLKDLWSLYKNHHQGTLLHTLDVTKWIFGTEGRWGKVRTDYFSKSFGDRYLPTSTERMAAAMILTSDLYLFKRIPSKCAEPSDFIIPGGFKPLDKNAVVVNQAKAFVDSLNKKKSAPGTEYQISDQSQRKIVHSLEMLAFGGKKVDLPPKTKQVFTFLGKEATNQEAQNILINLEIWSPHSNIDKKHQGIKEIDPWSNMALKSAQEISDLKKKRANMYTKGTLKKPQPIGSSLPSGYRDFRSLDARSYCIDAKDSSFFDDAVAWDQTSNMLMIHIADVQSYIKPNSVLDEVGRTRVFTQYLPKKPLFMLPPTALNALSFSNHEPNEAISVVIKLNPETGEIDKFTLVPSVIAPVSSLTYDEANDMLALNHENLSNMDKILSSVCEKLGLDALAMKRRKFPTMTKNESGDTILSDHKNSPAHLMVDRALAIYTHVTTKICTGSGIAMPVLVGQEKRMKSGKSRFGTAPLRRYVDLLAQRQLSASLGKSPPLNKKTITEAVHQLSVVRNRVLASNWKEDSSLKLEALAMHCRKSMEISGLSYAVVEGVATDKPGEAVIQGLGISVSVKGKTKNWKSGDRVKLRISKVDPTTKNIRAAV